jgi:hypothetical protein
MKSAGKLRPDGGACPGHEKNGSETELKLVVCGSRELVEVRLGAEADDYGSRRIIVNANALNATCAEVKK